MSDTLVTDNLKLVPFFVNRLHMFGEFDDLVQAGNIGLMQAAAKFDSSLGFQFSTYAAAWIKNAIRRESDRLKGPGITTKQNLAFQERRVVVAELEGKLQRHPTRDEIAEVAGDAIADLALDTNVSLALNPFGEPNDYIGTWLARDDTAYALFEDINQLDYLEPDEKALLVAFGMGYSLQEIGKAQGLHPQTVGIQVRKLQARLREEL